MGRDLLKRDEDTSISAVLTRIGRGAVYFGDECMFNLGELILIRADIPAYRPAAAIEDAEQGVSVIVDSIGEYLEECTGYAEVREAIGLGEYGDEGITGVEIRPY